MSQHYTHGFFVEDLSWLPAKKNAEAIHDVFVRWKLAGKKEKPHLYEIVAGTAKTVSGKSIEKNGEIPMNLVMAYARPPGKPWVAGKHILAIMGESEYSDDGWIWWMQVVLGADFKITSGGLDGEVFDVRTPARRSGKPVPPFAKRYPAGEMASYLPVAWACPGQAGTKPPEIAFHEHDYQTGERRTGDIRQSALWRSGILFDCENYHPSYVEEDGPYSIPNVEFLRDLESAFGTKLTQRGMLF